MPHLENHIYQELYKDVRKNSERIALANEVERTTSVIEIERITKQLNTLIQTMIPGFKFPGLDNLSLEKKINLHDKLNHIRLISNKIKHPKVPAGQVNETFIL